MRLLPHKFGKMCAEVSCSLRMVDCQHCPHRTSFATVVVSCLCK